MSKKFPLDLTSRGVLKLTDKLLVHNIDTGVTQYTTVLELLTAIGLSGVRFPAVQIPNANVNTLDDYEEGTFTPVLEFGGASVGITYADQLGYYTKIGNLVHILIYIRLTSKGASNGDAVIEGLPYAATIYAPVYIAGNNIAFADIITGLVATGGPRIILREITNAGVRTDITDADFANNTTLNLATTYRVA